MNPEVPLLQPYTVRSPGGTFRCEVMPSQHDGGGGSEMQFFREGTDAPLWKKDFDFTFWRACITDGGRIGGFGYSDGPLGARGAILEEGLGSLVVRVLDHQGEVVFAADERRSGDWKDVLDVSGRQLFLSGEEQRMVIALGDGSLSSYDLDEPAAWSSWRIQDLADLDLRWRVADAGPLPGTSLMLFQISYLVFRPIDEAIAPVYEAPLILVVKANGETVWSLEGDVSLARYKIGKIGEPLEKSFFISDQSDKERIYYEFRKVEGKWLVTETKKEPFRSEAETQVLIEQQRALFTKPRPDGRSPKLISTFPDSEVVVFDSVRVEESDNELSKFEATLFSFTSDGIFLESKLTDLPVHLENRRFEVERLHSEQRSVIRLIGENGELVREIHRHANGRWFEESSSIAVAEDGSFAVHDRDGKYPGYSAFDLPQEERPHMRDWVSLYDSDGIAQNTILIESPIPYGLDVGHVAYNGKHVAYTGCDLPTVTLMDSSGVVLGKAEIAGVEEEDLSQLTPVFIGGGSEVLIIHPTSKQGFQFSMPQGAEAH